MVRNFTFHTCDETMCQLFLAKLGWRNKTIVSISRLETEQKNMAPVQQSGFIPEINGVIPPISRVSTPLTHDFRSFLEVFTSFISSFPGPRRKLRLSYSSNLICYIYIYYICSLTAEGPKGPELLDLFPPPSFFVRLGSTRADPGFFLNKQPL